MAHIGSEDWEEDGDDLPTSTGDQPHTPILHEIRI